MEGRTEELLMALYTHQTLHSIQVRTQHIVIEELNSSLDYKEKQMKVGRTVVLLHKKEVLAQILLDKQSLLQLNKFVMLGRPMLDMNQCYFQILQLRHHRMLRSMLQLALHRQMKVGRMVVLRLQMKVGRMGRMEGRMVVLRMMVGRMEGQQMKVGRMVEQLSLLHIYHQIESNHLLKFLITMLYRIVHQYTSVNFYCLMLHQNLE